MSIPCTSPLEAYDNGDCYEQFAGGIKDIIIFTTALPVDPSSGSEILQMIADDEATVLESLKVGISAPSPITASTMISCSTDITTSYDRTITIMDGKVTDENIAFYNSLNAATGFTAKGMLLRNCDTDRCFYIDDTLRFPGGLVVPDNDNSDPQHFNFTATYRSIADPRIYATPAGVFST